MTLNQTGNQSSREMCDGCFLLSLRKFAFPNVYPGQQQVKDHNIRCKLNSKKDGCTLCDEWGRKCSFNPWKFIFAHINTIQFQPPWPLKKEKIDDPGYLGGSLT